MKLDTLDGGKTRLGVYDLIFTQPNSNRSSARLAWKRRYTLATPCSYFPEFLRRHHLENTIATGCQRCDHPPQQLIPISALLFPRGAEWCSIVIRAKQSGLSLV